METISKNFIYNALYQFLLILLPLITAPYVSRKLGANALGIYSYTYSVSFYFASFCLLGISNHGNRSIAASRDDKEKLSAAFWEIFIIQIVLSLLSIGIYIIYCIEFVHDNKLIYFLQLIYILSSAIDISWLFFGLEQFKITVFRNMVIKVSTVIFVFVFIKDSSDLWLYTIIISAGTLLSQIYLWFYIKRYVHFTRICFKNVLNNIKPIVSLYIPILAYSIYKVMDKIMIGSINTYSDVGIYQNAEKIVNIPMGIITALGTVMLPRMTNLISKGNKDKFIKYIQLSIEFVTVICCAIAFGLIGISNSFSIVYLGDEFESCGPIVKLLSISIFFVAWANVIRTQFLIPLHRDSVYLITTIVGALINFLINYFLIPELGAYGAAIGTIFAEASVFIVQWIFVRKEINLIKPFWDYSVFLLIGLLMAIVVHYVGELLGYSIKTLIIQVLIGIIIFSILYIITIVIKKDFMYDYFKKKFFKLK